MELHITRYELLSSGSAESVPTEGEKKAFIAREMSAGKSNSNNPAIEAVVESSYVLEMGRYVYINGRAQIDNSNLACVASYEVNVVEKEGNLIGHLTTRELY